MFETVVPARTSRTNRSALYEALSFSLVVHGLVACGALMSNLWKVTFPSASPLYTVSFILAGPPPPPPPPPPAKPIEQKPEMTAAKNLMAADVLAPTVIPDEIPVVKPQSIPVSAFAAATGVTGGVEAGVDRGAAGGIFGGDVGGKTGGTIGGVVLEEPPDGRIHIARDRKLPMVPLSQVYPTYPEDARIRSWEDELVVRYVIGKDGRVKDVSIVSPPERDLFIDVTLRAIRFWRFRPFVKDGERWEVVHEMTVYYRLNGPS